MIHLFVALAIIGLGALMLWQATGQDMGIADAVMRLWPL